MPTKTPQSWLRRYIFATSHRVVGVQYLLLALAAVIAGALLSLLMRWHLAWSGAQVPGWGIIKPEDYLALLTLHGTLMIFFVVTAAPQNGLASLVLPEQLGGKYIAAGETGGMQDAASAARMALPQLNALSVWLTFLALLALLFTPFLPGGAAISGWTSYPPLSAIPAAGPGQGRGMDGWLLSIALFSAGALLSAVSVIATVVTRRMRNMKWMEMPLTVWSWFVAACMAVPAFGVLLAACGMLFSDRHFGTSFFFPPVDVVNGIILHHAAGSPLLWQNLFWFFGHPEVYIAVLPAMGLTTTLLATFSQRPVLANRTMIVSTIAIGVLGFAVWGHHMFVSGMNPYASRGFGIVTIAIAIPSSIEVIQWLAVILGGGLRRATPLLFTLGFVSLFITGGLTGPILAQPILDSYLHNTFFVVAHFHLIMGMAGIFALFAAVYYWFPLLTGRRMSESLGRWHFWLSLAGAYAVFFPMHFAGMAAEPRQYAQLTGTAAYLTNLLPLQTFITVAAFLLVASQFIFLWNLAHSLRRGAPAGPDPWRAGTFEWLSAQNASIGETSASDKNAALS
ncbi:MAG: cbb3-type cytochrome c oxidase subunit I [Acidobacteriaceae bacterium]